MRLFSLLFTFICFLVCTKSFTQTDINSYIKENHIKTLEIEEGIHIEFKEKGSGTKIKQGDFAKISYTISLLNGVIVDQNIENEPLVFEVGYGQVIRGIDIGIQHLNRGAKAILYIPHQLAFGAQGKSQSIPPRTDLKVELHVLEIMNYQAYDQYMRAFEEQEQQEFSKSQETQFQKDKKIIRQYIKEHKIKAIELPSGVFYTITQKGKGVNAQKNNLLHVKYNAYLPNGSTFVDKQGGEYKFWLGRGMVIEGWEIGLRYFNSGSKGMIFIPSKFAYGPRAINEGDVQLPANAILIFEVEILSLKRP